MKCGKHAKSKMEEVCADCYVETADRLRKEITTKEKERLALCDELDSLRAELDYTRQQLKDAEEARDFWKKESDTIAAENAVLVGKLKEVEFCIGWTKPSDFTNKDQDKRFSELYVGVTQVLFSISPRTKAVVEVVEYARKRRNTHRRVEKEISPDNKCYCETCEAVRKLEEVER